MISLNLDLDTAKYKIEKAYRGFNYKQKRLITISVVAFIFALVLIIALLPSGKVVKPYEKVGLVVNGSIIDTKYQPVITSEEPLISYYDIKECIDENIFYDQKLKKVIITTPEKVIRIKADKTSGISNNKTFGMNVPMKIIDEVPYIPINVFKDVYDINVQYVKDNNVVVIDTKNIIYKSALLNNDVKLKKLNTKKAEVIKKLKEGQEVSVIGDFGNYYKIKAATDEGFVEKKYVTEDNIQVKSGIAKKNRVPVRKSYSDKSTIYEKVSKGETLKIYSKMGGWYKVRTAKGTVGFIDEKYVSKETDIPKPVAKSYAHNIWTPATGKINMVWEQIENTTPIMNNIDKVEGLDVVTPTWFEVIDSNGKVRNKADMSYVIWARANGYKVWAMVSNGLTQSKTNMTSAFLNNADARENAINAIVALAKNYEIDGLNIDFEYVNSKDKDVLTQFLRELEPLCRDKGLTLSVDITVKAYSDYSRSYDRKAINEIADYVVVMTYDQYWSTSPVSGSVAQLSWVESNLKSTLEDISKDKLIMGIPFYTRQWKEANGSKPQSTSISMPNAQNVIRQNNARVSWDESSGQYYAEFKKNNARYRIWVEDATSINLKSSLALKYDLAGTASWRRGYETTDIWGILNNNLKGYQNYNQWKTANNK